MLSIYQNSRQVFYLYSKDKILQDFELYMVLNFAA